MLANRKRGSPIAAQTIDAARTARSAKRHKANATTRAAIDHIQRSGVSTLAAVAQVLQSRGILTPAGRSIWHPVQVARLMAATRQNEARALRRARWL